jgi:hypothetical protein
MKNRIRNVGILPAFGVIAICLGALLGCDQSGGGNVLAAQVDLLPAGTAMQAYVVCLPSGSLMPVSGATVTVNGESVPEFFGNLSFNLAPVIVGADVTLHFVYQDIDILKALAMPAKPSNLTGAGTFPATNSITIGWDLFNPAPDNITVSVISGYTNSSDGYTAVLAGTAITHIIPGGTLKAGQLSIPVIVEAMHKTTDFGSSVGAGSFYSVGNQSSVNVATQ